MDPSMLAPLIALAFGTKLWFLASLLARTRFAIADAERNKEWVRRALGGAG
jgi:heme exporter protein C